MSQTVPSQRDYGSAVECALPSPQWDVFRAYLTVISTQDGYSSSSNVNNTHTHTPRCAHTDVHSRISRSSFVQSIEPPCSSSWFICCLRSVCYLSKQVLHAVNNNKKVPVYMHACLHVCISVCVCRCVCKIREHGDSLIKPSPRFPIVVYFDSPEMKFAPSRNSFVYPPECWPQRLHLLPWRRGYGNRLRNVKGAGKDPEGRVSPVTGSRVLRLDVGGCSCRVQRKVT